MYKTGFLLKKWKYQDFLKLLPLSRSFAIFETLYIILYPKIRGEDGENGLRKKLQKFLRNPLFFLKNLIILFCNTAFNISTCMY